MKPPLGPIPYLPLVAYCGCAAHGHYGAEPCPKPIPLGGPHHFMLLA